MRLTRFFLVPPPPMALPKAVLDLMAAVVLAVPEGTGRELQTRLFSRPMRRRAAK